MTTVALLTTHATNAFPANPVRHIQMRPVVLTVRILVRTDAAEPEPVALLIPARERPVRAA